MKYLITGGSGFIGTRLVESLRALPDTERVTIADVRAPAAAAERVSYEPIDVRDRARVRELVERERPDALVHLAFVLNPIHDAARMYDIDVNGTFNVLDAAARASTGHVLVTSSATAYGAFADNPEPITEDWPVRGTPSFSYASHKADADRLCQLWAAQNPDRTMTIVRPSIVLGPHVENYIVRSWTRQPFFPRFRGLPDCNVQFVHEDDVAQALSLLLSGGHGGAFNVAGDGVLRWTETAELIGMRVRTLPFAAVRMLNAALWGLRLPGAEAPPGYLDFVRYPWVCSNEKLKGAGWTPRYDTRETFELTMRARGLIAAADGAMPGAPDLAGAGDRAAGVPEQGPGGAGTDERAGG